MIVHLEAASAASTHVHLQVVDLGLVLVLILVLVVHEFEEMVVLIFDVGLLVGHLPLYQKIAQVALL